MARPPKYDDGEILDRAMHAFWRRGWGATSIRDLEAALELKAPSIYRRFGSRDGLGAAVVDHYVDRVVDGRVRRHLSGEGDPIDNIESFLVSAVTSGADGELWGCLVTTTSLEAEMPGPDLAEALARGRSTIEDGMRREVARASATGRLAHGLDPDDATAMLVLAMQGLMALARSGVSSDELRRRARSTVAVLATVA